MLYQWMGENPNREKKSVEMKNMEKKGTDDYKDSGSEFETESSHPMKMRKGK